MGETTVSYTLFIKSYITDYDGKEEVEIDYHHYELISTLLDDTMTDSEKINKLKEEFTRHI